MTEEEKNNILSAFFADESEDYRFPSEPDAGQEVELFFRCPKDIVKKAYLYLFASDIAVVMKKESRDAFFDFYKVTIVCSSEEMAYCFVAELEFGKIIYDKLGARQSGQAEEYAFRFMPGFHVPAWAKGAIEYQIFVDRFNNGDQLNDVCDNEYYYLVSHSRKVPWDELPKDGDIAVFHGGDLEGVRKKLDYIQSLGVEVIYFNPIFLSPSSHKYDIQDYDYIDPHFGVIAEDTDYAMEEWEKHNGYAVRYIKRVTSRKNLDASNALFASLCDEMHSRGMKIILDGVFNHCGSFNKWMDREGIYLEKPGYEKGAYQDVNSPYREFFKFSSGGALKFSEYEGWWGHITLPKLNYEESGKLKEAVFSIAEKWAKPPYSIDGWRLDVAADLGHSMTFNHEFWKEFRLRLKAVNPELLIIAEHYGNPRDWLKGDEWDTVMNYDAFMDPLSYFLTGMEKHSEEKRDDLYKNGEVFFDSILKNMAAFERPSLLCAMNQLSNHDHSRFLTRTNRQVGRISNFGNEKAGEGIDKAVYKQAVVIQMTWPGCPAIYYGDEAGLVGWTDPDNRRAYPWGNEDVELVDFHREIAKVRQEFPFLKEGSFIPLIAQNGAIGYARFNKEKAVFVVVNVSEEEREFSLRAVNAGIKDGQKISRRFLTSREGYESDYKITEISDGGAEIVLPAMSAAIYVTV